MDEDYEEQPGIEVLGLVEIAELLQVDKRTPYAWVTRGLMPDPDFPRVNGGKAWLRDTIIVWAARTGRLPDDLADERPESIPVVRRRGGPKAKRAMARRR